MACGGCGKRSQPVQVSKSTRSMPAPNTAGSRSAPKPKVVSAGVKAQVQKRCSKCSWPMNSTRHYNTESRNQVQVWTCMNRRCLHREEVQ